MNNLTNIAKKAPAWSREFDGLIRSIGECKSKAEEDAIISREVELLKPRLKDPKLDKRLLKELMVRLIYVEMLGHDASWGHVKALQACSDTNLLTKKVAYLASSLFLDHRSDTIILVVNTIQGDLKSDNFLVVSAALAAVCKLISPDLINAVLPSCLELVGHPRELVRKRAVMALHRFQQLDPARDGPLAGIDLDKHFRQALCDKDPSVMSAALCALHEVVSRDPRPYKNLIPSFVSILKQVAEHRLPKTYDYHKTPAPFIQINLLKILSLLGAGDKAASDNMYAVVADTMRRGNTGHTIGNAIVYECVRTITNIYPNPALLQSAAEMISTFLKSSSHNLKYIGVDALARIVRINAKYAAEHQLAVIDCLEDPDPTLKRKTLELLFKMTKSSNVEVIVEKMLEYLRGATDDVIKADVVKRIGELAERFAPDTQWFLDTMNQVFELGGDVVPAGLAHNLLRLVAEGAGEDDPAADEQLRQQAVASYLHLLTKPKLPDILLKVIFWVLGEYGSLAECGVPAVLDRLCALADTQALSDSTRGYQLTAVGKLCAQNGVAPTVEAKELLHVALSSRNVDLQQRGVELQALLSGEPSIRRVALPPDASCEDLDIDPALPSLNNHVQSALAAGAAPYITEEQRFAMGVVRPSHAEEVVEHPHALRFAAYERPQAPATRPAPAPAEVLPAAGAGLDVLAGAPATLHAQQTVPPRLPATEPQLALRTAGARRWGPAQFDSPTGNQARSASPASVIPEATVGRVVAPAVAESAHSEPAVSSQKQKLAASLFGDSEAVRAGKSRRPTVTPARAAASPSPVFAAAPAPPALDLLLDLDASAAPTPAPAQPAPPATADPFMQLGELSVPAPNTAGTASAALDLSALYAAAPPSMPTYPIHAHTPAGLASTPLVGMPPIAGTVLGAMPTDQPKGLAPMAPRGNAAVETAQPSKKDPFADLNLL